MSNDETMETEMQGFGLDESGADFNIGCFGAGGDKHPMNELDEWDDEEIAEFIEKVLKGKAKPYLKSQIPPKKQKGPVTVVVGKTFKDIVYDSDKDVLIEFYAPWCGHCKKFEPEYKKLAKELSHEKNLVIAKMDANSNDAPPNYSVSGFPTIYFAPANNKETPFLYEGNRDVEKIKEFLRNHASVAFKGKDEL